MDKNIKVPYQGKSYDALDMEFKTIKEEWNEYETSDGSSIRLKVVVTNIARVKGQYDKVGNPIYVVRSSNVVSIVSPENLKQKTAEG